MIRKNIFSSETKDCVRILTTIARNQLNDQKLKITLVEIFNMAYKNYGKTRMATGMNSNNEKLKN